MIPSTADIGKISSDKDKTVGCCQNLFWSVHDITRVDEVNFRFNLINDHFERLVDVMRRVDHHSVELEVNRGNPVLVRF